jgi:hypothetical protein
VLQHGFLEVGEFPQGQEHVKYRALHLYMH